MIHLNKEKKALEVRKKFELNKEYIYENVYKSQQGGIGDCVMHAINNILGNEYLSNWVTGKLFVKNADVFISTGDVQKDQKIMDDYYSKGKEEF